MRISDDERREVAANMRSAAERAKDDLNDDSNYSKLAVLYVVSCGVRGVPRYKDLLHLADLIDRPIANEMRECNDIEERRKIANRHRRSAPRRGEGCGGYGSHAVWRWRIRYSYRIGRKCDGLGLEHVGVRR